jgi:hypothetical protein
MAKRLDKSAILRGCRTGASGQFQVGPLNVTANQMRQGGFRNLTRNGVVATPIAEAGTEAVDGDILTKLLQHVQHGSVGHRPVVSGAREYQSRKPGTLERQSETAHGDAT